MVDQTHEEASQLARDMPTSERHHRLKDRLQPGSSLGELRFSMRGAWDIMLAEGSTYNV